ncbi:MAG: lytic transglycosylase domain-containing protein [Candidatus Sulfotelmatobacter sp.]
MKRAIQLIAWGTLLSILPCRAADSAVLRNGYSIRHDHRQIIGAITRLYLDGDKSNFVDVPTAEIDHFEELPADASRSALESTAPETTSAMKAASPLDLNEVIKNASGTYRLDPDLVNSVIRAESGFNVRAVSPKGAQGLMQLMPQTASQLGVQNAFDPQANVEGGTRYLRELLERYDFDLIKALAAYNAGPQRVEQYGGVPPYYETKAYVARIVRDFNKKKLATNAASPHVAPKTDANKTARTSAATAKVRKSSSQTQARNVPAESSHQD